MSVNETRLLGNLGADPTTHTFPDGTLQTKISVATTDTWKDRKTGEKLSHTEWHSVVFRGRLAEVARDYLKKGRSVWIAGALRTQRWMGKDGAPRYTTFVLANKLEMLGARPEGLPAESPGGDGEQDPPLENIPVAGVPGDDDFEDDIPF